MYTCTYVHRDVYNNIHITILSNHRQKINLFHNCASRYFNIFTLHKPLKFTNKLLRHILEIISLLIERQ